MEGHTVSTPASTRRKPAPTGIPNGFASRVTSVAIVRAALALATLTRSSLVLATLFTFVSEPAFCVTPLGDLTEDGAVTIADANALWRIANGLETASPADSLRGDVSPRPGTGGRAVGDGILDGSDVDRILDLLLGNITAAAFHGVPSVEEIFPAAASQGDSLSLFTILGSSFSSVCSLAVDPPGGIVVSNLTVESDGLVRARLAIDPSAATGVRQVRLVSLGGTSATGVSSELTLEASGGPAPSLVVGPATLTLTAGGASGFVTLHRAPEASGASTISASSGDASIASAAASTAVPADASDAILQIQPMAVGATTVSGTWTGLPFSASVEVVEPFFAAVPDSFHLFQTGLTDTLTLHLTRQSSARTITLASSDPSIVTVPSSISFPADQDTFPVEIVPENSYGDAVITATLPPDLGGEALSIPVHVEQLKVTIYSVEDPIEVRGDQGQDDPDTPIDEAFGTAGGGLLLQLNGASRVSQTIELAASPPLAPPSSGFTTVVDSVTIAANQVFSATEFRAAIFGSTTPPVMGTFTATLASNGYSDMADAVMSRAPMGRDDVRFCDSEVGMVVGQESRRVSVVVDQVNGAFETPPSFSFTSSGSSATFTADGTTEGATPSGFFFKVSPVEPGSSALIVTISPDGLKDTLVVNVLAPQITIAAPNPGGVDAGPRAAQQETNVIQMDGLQVVENGATADVKVKLPGAENAKGSLVVQAVPDRFQKRPDKGPDMAPGSSGDPGTPFVVAEVKKIENDPALKSGEEKTFSWNLRDSKGNVVHPGRYRIRVLVRPQARDWAKKIGGENGIEQAFGANTVVNMAQVAYLLFPAGFANDLEAWGIQDPLNLAAARVEAQMAKEYRVHNDVNVIFTRTEPPAGFRYTTLEFLGADPKNEALGRTELDLGNKDPGESWTHAKAYGVFPRQILDRFSNGGATAGEKADFRATFLDAGHDNSIARDIFANMLTFIGVHELGHGLGLVAGDVIGAFADPLPAGVTRFVNHHNNNGAADSPGRFYMDDGRFLIFREEGMIAPGATAPFGSSDYGMDAPFDFSAAFGAVNKKYLERLLPKGATVP